VPSSVGPRLRISIALNDSWFLGFVPRCVSVVAVLVLGDRDVRIGHSIRNGDVHCGLRSGSGSDGDRAISLDGAISRVVVPLYIREDQA
jgi:hypothetical protein